MPILDIIVDIFITLYHCWGVYDFYDCPKWTPKLLYICQNTQTYLRKLKYKKTFRFSVTVTQKNISSYMTFEPIQSKKCNFQVHETGKFTARSTWILYLRMKCLRSSGSVTLILKAHNATSSNHWKSNGAINFGYINPGSN